VGTGKNGYSLPKNRKNSSFREEKMSFDTTLSAVNYSAGRITPAPYFRLSTKAVSTPPRSARL
jgi:hypothetical protein